MERETQLLIADDPLTAEEARRQTFPTVMRGLDRTSVEDFQQRTANQLFDWEQEIARLTGQLQQLQAQLDNRPEHPGAGHGVDVLAMATNQADAIIRDAQDEARGITQDAEQRREAALADARQQHDRIIAEARQQAGGIVGRARQEAEREAARIKREAPVEAQRITAHYVALAAEIRSALIADVDALGAKLRGWNDQAHQGPDPAAAQG